MGYKIPNEDVDFFPEGGELTSDNLNQAPKEIQDNVLSLRDRTQILMENIEALQGEAQPYDSSKNYYKKDIVRNNKGIYYKSKKDDNKGNALTDGDYWIKFYMPIVNQETAIFKEFFIVVDSNSNGKDFDFTETINPQFANVFVNGVKVGGYVLKEDSIHFTDSLNNDDEIDIQHYRIGSLLDMYRFRRLFSGTLIKAGDFIQCITEGDPVDQGKFGYKLTLSLVAEDGAIIKLADVSNNASKRPILIDPQSMDIMGVNETLLLDEDGFTVELVYDKIKNSWNFMSK